MFGVERLNEAVVKSRGVVEIDKQKGAATLHEPHKPQLADRK